MAEVATSLAALAERWAGARAGERANLQLYLVELCDALRVGRPQPRGTGYEFELQIHAITVEGAESANFIDCWKAGHFALEGKDDQRQRQGRASNEALLRRAYGQVRNYVHHVPGEAPPPYLMVLDVAKTLIVWDRWAGTYGGFEAGRRIDLATLHQRPDDIALLRDVWEHPAARDRRGRAQLVTTELATKLARLAGALEGRGHHQEDVARFLMRVVFSCFAEDVGLLPAESFRQTVTEAGLKGSPAEFTAAVEGLWRLMDVGGRVGPLKLLRFNGHFFRDATALPLTSDELALLETAAKAEWADVEPAIFGTLLTRALDPGERHRLGAEYTPPAFIERLVRPTVEEPLRVRWTAVEAEVVQLLDSGKPRDRARAVERLEAFHDELLRLRVLDPACGSGNFLYVTMHLVKNIEVEVLRTLERVTGQANLRLKEVTPAQFSGIEVKPWAREIAELTLWIGFHQFWRRHHDVQPPEPILQDTGTLALRDAVLAWDATRRDPSRDRPDPTPRIPSPVTGQLVPDPAARLAYVEYVGARPAAWPEADFIVGNPPYIGGKRIRAALGDGYADALQAAYPGLPDAADLVMYWWAHAARLVGEGKVRRAGLITTSSIRQTHNRPVVEAGLAAGARIVWSVADHPWSDESDGAAVRVAMTVLARDDAPPRLGAVDAHGAVRETSVPRINADLSGHADVGTAAAQPLLANAGLCYFGFLVNGPGFLLEPPEYAALLAADARNREVLKPILGGRDVAQRPVECYVIDFGERSREEAQAYPLPYNLVLDRVKPRRDANRDKGIRENWWRFHRIRQELRKATAGLARFIVTTETMKHRVFTFLDAGVALDHSLVCIAVDDAFVLGVLSSTLHVWWAVAAGGKLGVGNDPRYNRTVTFDPFPFPSPPADLRQRIGELAERIDTHRKDAVARDPAVTVTALYNVVEKLRAGAPLTPKERAVNMSAACGVLRELHDALDEAVTAAYGWTWPMTRDAALAALVALHDARVEEERRGQVRWLRPGFQQPRTMLAPAEAPLDGLTTSPTAARTAEAREPWPADAIGQITSLRMLVVDAPVTVEGAARSFVGAPRVIVQRHLETLELLGEVVRDGAGRYAIAAAALGAM
jgi:hypothetical protein